MSDPFFAHAKSRPVCAARHVALDAGAQTLAEVADVFVCQTDGTITITDAGGTAVAYARVAGDMVPFRASIVNVGSGTWVAWYT